MRISLQAGLWAVASAATFAASSAAAKFLALKLPTAELAFFRAAFGVLVLAGAARLLVDLGRPRDPWGYALRCGLGVVALYSLMFAFSSMPLGLASLLFFCRVLLMPVTARVMLGERSSPAVWAGVLTGFVGAVVSLWPALTVPELRLPAAAALLAAVASAGSQTAVRRLTATNSAGLIVLIYTAASVAATGPVAAVNWIGPPISDWPLLAVLGSFAVLAQLTAAKAYAKASVGFLAPFDFLTVPAAAVLGFVLFGEVPTLHGLAGSALIVAGTLLVYARGTSTGAAAVNP
ncbi:EamA domain-containing membrane protein RarD [Azospirillum oryzae]|uniref:EamA domain-containing membrane protein RarD n=1 Tax=Azospirillum oryzae TaxID=286727 RepID=A0A1X7ESW5_9PROT|nr:DMT family transporter [Azospirillum oryzae]SMF39327.1 EamA domain-containing membrane protein RarD [Azospirillum oryzae]